MASISRKEYVGLFGPTTGDRIRLGDTLFVEIERDLRGGYGDEIVFGGGKSLATGVSSPYTAGWGIGYAGQGGSRDAGAGPAFTGFVGKIVTAAGAVAIGAVVETGYTNRSGVALTTGQSVLGSFGTASAAPS